MNKYIAILLFFTLFSCTKPINIDYPDQTPSLVVNSVFNEDKIITVRLTQTIAYNSTENNKVTNAECKLFCDDEFIEILENHENGNYTSSIIPEIGKNYQIQISCEGFESVSAESYIPEYPNIFRYDTIPTAIFDPDDGLGIYYTNASLYIEDNSNQNNFYQLRVFLKNTNSSGGSVNTVHRYKSEDPILVSEGIMPYQPYVLLFSDNLFNGQNKTIYFQHTSPTWSPDTLLLIVETKSLTENYFKYLKSSIIQANNQGSTNDILAIGEPIEIYTNIKNGYGIFTGVNIHLDTIVLNGWNVY